MRFVNLGMRLDQKSYKGRLILCQKEFLETLKIKEAKRNTKTKKFHLGIYCYFFVKAHKRMAIQELIFRRQKKIEKYFINFVHTS